ncbi:flagellar motor protein MotB [Lentibacillus sp. Marseille-P4043]|uniref:flagellar motor protein MotB n=1 Tax=Lentibacillus sp. Marseille-P4043 TaxID=2040293 RepID=UPI002D78F19D|nr:flagellar motor protein MotB [Lentibacillus sp. Marseille-P4043]
MRRKKQRKEHEVDESWLLPYSDLLTLLFALFIVLFAMSEIDSQKYEQLSQVFKSEFSGGDGFMEKGSGPTDSEGETIKTDEDEKDTGNEKEQMQEREQLENLKNEINAYITNNDLAKSLGAKLTDDGLLITILNDVTFDSGSSTVNDAGKRIAKEVSTFLHTDPPHQIVVSGHTDDRPIKTSDYGSNWELSVMRAVNYMKLLLQNDTLDPERFSAKGFGEYQPIVPNTNNENRAKNRRVEVLILPNHELELSDDEDDNGKQ